ncbi:MAG: GBS Bsp-like repeat-containing protein, partial [Lachnospiraceae bacterium]|nr:GBS Bsp-like repeat-containing protein [Lachnospiraceae bacterium]
MSKRKTWKQMMAGMLTAVTILGSMPSPVFAALPEENQETELRSVQADGGPEEEDLATDISVTEETEVKEDISDGEEIPEEEADHAVVSEVEQEESYSETQTVEELSVGDPVVVCDPVDPVTGKFTIRVRNCQLSAGDQILVPVWQEAKQKDLVWNTAVREGEEYVVRETTAAHGYLTGEYQIHVYRKNSVGQMTFLAKTAVRIIPEAEGISTERAGNQVYATLTGVKLYDTSDSVQLAVWSETNGQDDLVWETAKRQSDGSWKATIPLSKHTGTGICHVHAYAFTRTGVPVCLKKTTFQLGGISADSIKATTPDPSTGEFTVTISGITAPAGIAKIQVPIWSKPDQSDIYWYTAEKQGDAYIARCNLSKHRNNTGTYQIHVYLTDLSGYRSFLTMTTMKAESLGALEVTNFAAAVSNGTFTLSADKITAPFSVKTVSIAVWNKADQSDLVWYTPVKDGERYIVNSSIAKHKFHTGTYQAHLYLQNSEGKMVFGGKTSFSAALDYPSLKVVTSADQTSVQAILSNLQTPDRGGVVRFAVWSEENGQDDLRWYTAAGPEGNQTATIPVANHRSTGACQIHAYVFWPDNSYCLIGKTTFTVANAAVNAVKVSNVDHTKGSFTITVTAADASGIDYVRTAVWSKADQSNLVWYKGVQQTDGSWTASMQIENHKGLYGVYHVHAYAVMKDGSSKLLAVTDTELKESNRFVSEKLSEDTIRLTIYSPNLNGKTAESVVFPTWSQTNGQDDLVWYKGVKQADGSYQVTVKQENHKHDGVFYTHVYVKYAGEEKLVQATSYTLAKSVTQVRELDAEALAVMRNILYAVETGGQVYGRKQYDNFT